MNFNPKPKLSGVKSDQSDYRCTMTFDEMQRKQSDYDKKTGKTPLTLDEINTYINEVRNG